MLQFCISHPTLQSRSDCSSNELAMLLMQHWSKRTERRVYMLDNIGQHTVCAFKTHLHKYISVAAVIVILYERECFCSHLKHLPDIYNIFKSSLPVAGLVLVPDWMLVD